MKSCPGRKIGGFGTVSASYDHAATDEENYPYPGSVTNAAGDYVHYGDWVMESDLGKLGVFYWEYETGGANNGYHISYIGFDGSAEKRGESLCETHDDGGVITRFGYGYYWKDGQTKPAFTTSKFCAGTTAVSEISEKLREQIPGYTFTAFESGENGLRRSQRMSGTRNGRSLLEHTLTGILSARSLAMPSTT